MELLVTSKESLPDVLFLDLNMPLKPGFECLAEIMQHDKFRTLPIIVCSTSMDQPVVDFLYEKGVFHYIRKPGEYSKLKNHISKGIENLFNIAIRHSKENFVIHP